MGLKTTKHRQEEMTQIHSKQLLGDKEKGKTKATPDLLSDQDP